MYSGEKYAGASRPSCIDFIQLWSRNSDWPGQKRQKGYQYRQILVLKLILSNLKATTLTPFKKFSIDDVIL